MQVDFTERDVHSLGVPSLPDFFVGGDVGEAEIEKLVGAEPIKKDYDDGSIDNGESEKDLTFISYLLVKAREGVSLCNENNSDHQCHQSMRCSPKYESNKVPNVPITHASANPRTMMIVHFDAHVTVCAMEGSRWSQEITCFTIGQLISTYLYDFLSIFIINLWHKLKLFQIIIHLDI